MKGMGKCVKMWWVKGSVEGCVGGGVGSVFGVWGEVWEVCWGRGRDVGRVEKYGEV